MRLYPAAPRRLAATVAGDVAILMLLLCFGRLGLLVHDAVGELATLGEGVASAGGGVSSAFGAAADGIDGVPLVGGELAEQLRAAGRGTGGEIVAAGREGERRVLDLADTLAWLTFLIPAALLLILYLPGRAVQVRRLTAGARAVRAAAASPRLLAMRAAFSLPYPVLLRHTPDPFGDLERGEYDRLAAAAREDAGLRAEAVH
jgi:hypothetical protein